MAKALLFGATGLIGSSLAPLLTKDYERVVCPVRKPTAHGNDSLQMPVVDFARLSTDHRDVFAGAEALFYCLGTTRARAGSTARFQAEEWQMANAVLGTARDCGVRKVVMISSRGADENSLIPYLRVKGHVERYARDLGFEHLVIARPSLLMGERSESRLLEGLSISLVRPLLRPLQRRLPKFAPIQDSELARALITCARETRKSLWIAENDELIRLGTAGGEGAPKQLTR